MSAKNDYKFTAFWYRLPSTGEKQPAPKVKNGEVAVPYRDDGYHGGEYWAILPANWTIESAIALFESEGHINSLVEVNFESVPYQPTDY